MTDATPTHEDIEQHEIAARILFNALTITLDRPGALDRVTAATFLHRAADERERQGDFRAAVLLDEWAQMLGQSSEDEE